MVGSHLVSMYVHSMYCLVIIKRAYLQNQWDENPVAYLNIRYVQKEYNLPPKTNAVDTLVRLQPSAL